MGRHTLSKQRTYWSPLWSASISPTCRKRHQCGVSSHPDCWCFWCFYNPRTSNPNSGIYDLAILLVCSVLAHMTHFPIGCLMLFLPTILTHISSISQPILGTLIIPDTFVFSHAGVWVHVWFRWDLVLGSLCAMT